MTARYVILSGDTFLEISVERPDLRRPFFFLVLAIRDLLFGGTLRPVAALSRALLENRALLTAEEILSDDALLGLFGELWFLDVLIEHNGPAAIQAWTGPQKQPHDFRFGAVEVEVKATRSATRRHTINGLEQLTPSKDCTLFLLSIQGRQTGPGAGSTIPEMVSMIRHKLAIDVGEEERFLQALRDCGYLEQDEPKYELRIALANAPHLIKIDKNFPALTRPGVSSLVGNDHSSRIMDVRYELDVTGMGMADGTATFVEALGLHN
jgi:hypothetical protein